AIVERYNYTLLSKIKKYMARANTLRYVDVLSDLVANYNNTKHSMIKKRPINVFTGKEYPYEEGLGINPTDLPIVQPFKIGDIVRYKKTRGTFDKRGFVPTFSAKLHKIEKINNNKYLLSNGRSYYAEELVKGTAQEA